MVRTKREEYIVCDLCDIEMSHMAKCGICSRDVCNMHRLPMTMEKPPQWHPFFCYLCTDCAVQPEIEELIVMAARFRGLTLDIQQRVIGDGMGKLTDKGEE